MARSMLPTPGGSAAYGMASAAKVVAWSAWLAALLIARLGGGAPAVYSVLGDSVAEVSDATDVDATVTDLQAFSVVAEIAATSCVKLKWKVRTNIRGEAREIRPRIGIQYKIRCCAEEGELKAMFSGEGCNDSGIVTYCRSEASGESAADRVVWLASRVNASGISYAAVAWKVPGLRGWSSPSLVRLRPLDESETCPFPQELPPEPRQNRLVCIIAVSPVLFIMAILLFYAVGLKTVRVDNARYVFPRAVREASGLRAQVSTEGTERSSDGATMSGQEPEISVDCRPPRSRTKPQPRRGSKA